MNQSIATINSPEFINLKPLDINPLMDQCEIKVLYLGANRNHSFITKEVALDMAKTLRGAPIVGYWNSETDDFEGHEKELIIDEEGIKFKNKTIPYGFVAPNAEVWFQKFNDVDVQGNTIEREYLMTTGYLWTKQFEECRSILDGEGKPQSMELDEDTIKGSWTKQSGVDFFIINDAIFSKLCILGENVEPCFEGANISAPRVSASFTKVDDTFKQTLFSMMQELKTALEGESQMENEVTLDSVVEVEPVVEFEAPIVEPEQNSVAPSVATEPEVEVEEAPAKPSIEEEFALSEQRNQELQEALNSLQANYAKLQEEDEALKTAYAELVEFKRQIDDAKKDDMINRFYMLSDEDKAEIRANKANYTVEEIEEKLSVICFRKKVNFSLEEDKTVTQPVMTFSVSDTSAVTKPDWLIAVDNIKRI